MAVPDRVAVVTGTSAGLGLATARILLARGWSVIGVARRPASLTHEAYRHEQLDLGDLPLVEAFAAGLAAEAEAGVGGTARDLAVVSYEPGMVDTAMQAENRAASPQDLPDVALFVALQAQGRLAPPERPASEVAGFLERDDLPAFSERRLGA